MKYTSRQIAIIGLLAATNGAVEITLGNYLHILHFYFTGNIMIGFNCIIYMLGRKAVPMKGTIFLIGFISAFIKLLMGWNINANAAVSIFIEAILMEISITFVGYNMAGAIIGTVSANIWALFQKLVMASLIGGESFTKNLTEITDKASRILFFDKSYIAGAIIFIILIYAAWGVIFGLIGWRVTQRLSPRMCPNQVEK
jgi:hypothetical protein